MRNTTGETVAVRFEGLTKHFGDVCAVDHLDLEIRQGETVALLGPNGAGKTTSVSMLLGLLAPDAGKVSVLGMSPEAAIQSGRIGAMLQEGGLMPGMSVGELLDFVLSLRASPFARGQLIATAGLDGLERRWVDRLSGGQTQRLRFALAIASEPEILVLDEPTAAMDVEARHSFWAKCATTPPPDARCSLPRTIWRKPRRSRRGSSPSRVGGSSPTARWRS
jgi:ABC-2 type transport system ATP-binding protein